jgi:hypothetical protein
MPFLSVSSVSSVFDNERPYLVVPALNQPGMALAGNASEPPIGRIFILSASTVEDLGQVQSGSRRERVDRAATGTLYLHLAESDFEAAKARLLGPEPRVAVDVSWDADADGNVRALRIGDLSFGA